MNEEWIEREAVVTVKAYPNPSSKYFETVCVAAVTEEEGLIRLYPVGFRSLPEDQRFKKYQRVRLRMRKHERDQRPESYRPDEHSIELLDVIDTSDNWRARWQWIRPTIGPTMGELQRQQENLSRDELEYKIRQKYMDEMCGPNKDTHFFVGNHSYYRGSFMVLGIFWPPKSSQQELF